MYLRVLPERADSPLDIDRLVTEALEQTTRIYANLAQIVMQCGDDSQADNDLCVLIAQAQAANSAMLATVSTMRHPSGGVR